MQLNERKCKINSPRKRREIVVQLTAKKRSRRTHTQNKTKKKQNEEKIENEKNESTAREEVSEKGADREKGKRRKQNKNIATWPNLMQMFGQPQKG